MSLKRMARKGTSAVAPCIRPVAVQPPSVTVTSGPSPAHRSPDRARASFSPKASCAAVMATQPSGRKVSRPPPEVSVPAAATSMSRAKPKLKPAAPSSVAVNPPGVRRQSGICTRTSVSGAVPVRTSAPPPVWPARAA